MAMLPMMTDDQSSEELQNTGARLPQAPRRSMHGVTTSVLDAPVENVASEDNFAQKILRPREDERIAANEGRRWRNALQRDALIPGSEYAEQVRQMAAIERDPTVEATGDHGMSSAELRAREMKRRAMMGQYDKLISDFGAGRWNDDAEGADAARAEGDRLKTQYEVAGFDIGDLRQMPRQSASTSQMASKAMSDIHETILDAGFIAQEMQEAVASGKPIDANVLDKVAQKLAAALGGDSKSMADAEKVRIQIQYLPPKDKARVISGIKRYRKMLDSVMAVGGERRWSANWRDKMASINKDLAAGNYADAMGGMVALVNSTESQLPTDLASGLQSAKIQYDDYLSNMTMAAQIDNLALYNTAKYLFEQGKSKLNKMHEVRGSNRRFKDEFPAIDEAALLGLNSHDNEFIAPPPFTPAQRARDPNLVAPDVDAWRSPGSNNPTPGGSKKPKPPLDETRYRPPRGLR